MRKLPIIALIFSFFFLLPAWGKIWAATFSLNPDTKTLNVGDTLTIELFIDTEGQEVTNADAVFTYDPNVLQFESIEPGTFFSNTLPYPNITPGKVGVGGVALPDLSHPDPDITVSGQGLIATLNFKAVGSGSATFSFACTTDPGVTCCTPEEVRDGTCEPRRNCIYSSVLLGRVNYINCASLVDGNYTVSGPGDIPTATPAPPGSFPPGEPTCDLCGACKDREGQISKPGNWQACRSCIYNPDGSRRQGYSWTPIGCLTTQAGGFVQSVLGFVLRLAGGVSFLFILYGGFLMVTSRGEYDRLLAGKRLVIGAVGALLLLLFAVFLLRFIGVNILGLPMFV